MSLRIGSTASDPLPGLGVCPMVTSMPCGIKATGTGRGHPACVDCGWMDDGWKMEDGGGGGIRTPGPVKVSCFQNRRNRPDSATPPCRFRGSYPVPDLNRRFRLERAASWAWLDQRGENLSLRGGSRWWVGMAGFEPAPSSSPNWRATWLRHIPRRADGQDRTGGLSLTMAVLYQLSYISVGRSTGFEPVPPGPQPGALPLSYERHEHVGYRWRRWDSNPRPSACKADALPG